MFLAFHDKISRLLQCDFILQNGFSGSFMDFQGSCCGAFMDFQNSCCGM